ncbi:Nuclear envelope protein ndc1 [Bienertia sinuspersici]
MGKLSFKLAFLAFFLLLVSGPTLGNNVLRMKNSDTNVVDDINAMKAIMKEVAKEKLISAYNNYKQEKMMSRKIGLQGAMDGVGQCIKPYEWCTFGDTCCSGYYCSPNPIGVCTK